MTAYADGPEAERRASDYSKTNSTVTRATKVTMKLAPGGGWVARIQPKAGANKAAMPATTVGK